MHELVLIHDLVVVWLAALVAGAICVRLKMPPIAGYVIAGIFVGPFGFKLVSGADQVHVLAEIGVALLLFALGVEISLRKILSAARKVVVAAALQIAITVLVAALISLSTGLATKVLPAIVLGFVCALSSTAVVTKLLVDRGETETVHARVLVPLLLMQDLVLIPVVVLLPVIKDLSDASFFHIAHAFGKAALLIAFVGVTATYFVPRLLKAVTRTNSRELFLLTIISLCMSVALLSNMLGVSLALGAFLAGIMISEQPYGHQALADIMPVRDLFATVFFVSIGMLLDPMFVVHHPFMVLAFTGILIFGKAIIGALAAYYATRSWWSSVLVGAGLAQMGEFSFVLATLANQQALLSPEAYNLFFAGAVVTLVLSPLVIAATPELLPRIPYFRLLRHAGPEKTTTAGQTKIKDHVILCGYGRMGRNIALSLQAFQLPLVVVETRGETIEELGLMGIRHIYGDAMSPHVLLKAGLNQAKCIVVAVPDPIVALNIVAFARKQNAGAVIIARINNLESADGFGEAGADAVIQPELEGGIEATRLALTALGRPAEETLEAVRNIRRREHLIFEKALRDAAPQPLESQAGSWFVYDAGEAESIQDMDIRKRTGATVLAIKRGQALSSHPDPAFLLQKHDQLYVAGKENQLEKFQSTYQVQRFCPITPEAEAM